MGRWRMSKQTFLNVEQKLEGSFISLLLCIFKRILTMEGGPLQFFLYQLHFLFNLQLNQSTESCQE